MGLASPTEQLVSVYRHTSHLRGCNPIEESKQEPGSFRSYCTSMDPPKSELKSQQPRIYLESNDEVPFYPYRNASPYEHSSSTRMAAVVPDPRSSGDDESEEDAVRMRTERLDSRDTFSTSHNEYSPSRSPILRKRKSSWPTSGDEMEVKDKEARRSGDGERSDVGMNPMSSSGLPAGERLPGIAHLDEQMLTPWSVGNARQNSISRGSGVELDDSLRRISPQTYSRSGSGSQSWRGPLHDSRMSGGKREGLNLPSISDSPRFNSMQRPSLSYHGPPPPPRPLDNEYSRSRANHQTGASNIADRITQSAGASPSMRNGLRRSPFEGDQASSYSRRVSDWSESRSAPPLPPQLPTANSLFDERRSSKAYEEGERGHRQSLGGLHERRTTYPSESSMDRSEYSSDLYSNRPREVTGNLRSSSSSSPYDLISSSTSLSGPDRGGNYSQRVYDRDSPSYYDEGASQHHNRRDQQHSPRQDPYSVSGSNTSPNVPRRRGKLPKVVTDLLKTWLLDHASHPYPTEDEKRRLCNVTGLSISQVSNWFINARRRILVPQGSGNFALNHHSSQSNVGALSSGGGSGSIPTSLHHTPSPPHLHHHRQSLPHPPPQHHSHSHQQHPHHVSMHSEDSAHQHHQHHHLYRRSNSHSPRRFLSRSMKEDV